MSKINLLDQNTINQIAAGEVIDRPSSVVKELLENAIDAGASIITVEIKDGGTSLIRITDNGCGIEKEDIRTAFLRHTTSKIKSVEDLLYVSSLGFRGEALSSIAAVCQVELITKTAESLTGTRYLIEGGKELRMEDVGAPNGTTFLVKNIFYNTPARRKFLKAFQTEAGYISDVVERIALSHPEISIRFINNGQGKIHTSGNGELKDVIYNIYGRDAANNIIALDYSNDFMSITGFIGKPVMNKGNRSQENYFINSRYIKSQIVAKAIEEAYKPYMMQHKYPFTVIHFSIKSELLDVNVHPAKMELRFRNAENIYPFIVESLGEALKEKPLIPDVTLEEKKEKTKTILQRREEKAAEPFEVNRILNAVNSQEEIQEKRKIENDILKRKDISKINVPAEPKHNVIPEAAKAEKMPVNNSSREKSAEIKEETNVYNNPDIRGENISLFGEEFLSEKARVKHKIVGQVFDTYWIVEYDEKMFIIDQHAAHEKVMYETLMDRLRKKEIASQNVNPPIIISLSMSEEVLLNNYIEEFRKIGFEIEPFGGREFAIRAVPLDLYALNDKSLIMDIIDSLSAENGKISSNLLTDKIASMSCKAAVKGNNKLSYAEANELIDKLLTLDNPYHCPHGRPTIIAMSKYELEKKFKRIV